ncbi:MAG: DUF4382 domain-containing protein [Candidatus Thermoplasmatota archaeon]|jgi:hypothetical protein
MTRSAASALLAATLSLAFLLAGCSSSGGDGSASVYVKDAPTDEFDEIHVVFTKVEVHAAGDDGDDADDSEDSTTDDNETDGDDDNSTAGWRTLFEDSAGVDVDLLNASGTHAAFLGEADLPAGKYTQLRITVTEAYGIDNGTRVPITVSSGTLKLNHPFDVEEAAETRIVLDIDLDRSLHQQGGGAWRMTPVVGSVEAEEVDDEESGEDASEEGEIEDLEDDA